MRTLIGWLTALVCGAVGWWLGMRVGVGTGVILSAVGSGAGLWAGYRWFDQNLG